MAVTALRQSPTRSAQSRSPVRVATASPRSITVTLYSTPSTVTFAVVLAEAGAAVSAASMTVVSSLDIASSWSTALSTAFGCSHASIDPCAAKAGRCCNFDQPVRISIGDSDTQVYRPGCNGDDNHPFAMQDEGIAAPIVHRETEAHFQRLGRLSAGVGRDGWALGPELLKAVGRGFRWQAEQDGTRNKGNEA